MFSYHCLSSSVSGDSGFNVEYELSEDFSSSQSSWEEFDVFDVLKKHKCKRKQSIQSRKNNRQPLKLQKYLRSRQQKSPEIPKAQRDQERKILIVEDEVDEVQLASDKMVSYQKEDPNRIIELEKREDNVTSVGMEKPRKETRYPNKQQMVDARGTPSCIILEETLYNFVTVIQDNGDTHQVLVVKDEEDNREEEGSEDQNVAQRMQEGLEHRQLPRECADIVHENAGSTTNETALFEMNRTGCSPSTNPTDTWSNGAVVEPATHTGQDSLRRLSTSFSLKDYKSDGGETLARMDSEPFDTKSTFSAESIPTLFCCAVW